MKFVTPSLLALVGIISSVYGSNAILESERLGPDEFGNIRIMLSDERFEEVFGHPRPLRVEAPVLSPNDARSVSPARARARRQNKTCDTGRYCQAQKNVFLTTSHAAVTLVFVYLVVVSTFSKLLDLANN